MSRKKAFAPLSDSSGLTLIEILVALAIGSVVIFGAVRFITQTQETGAKNDAREAAAKTNKSILEMIKRDFKFQTGFSIADSGRTLNLKRRALYQGKATASDYNASFQTVCSPIVASDPAAKSLLTKLFAQDLSPIFAKAPGLCLQSVKCSHGLIPQLKVKLAAAGAMASHYPVTDFPSSAGPRGILSNKHSLGTAVCFEQTSSKVQVIVESLYLIDGKSGKLGLISDEGLLTVSEFSNVEILPAK